MKPNSKSVGRDSVEPKQKKTPNVERPTSNAELPDANASAGSNVTLVEQILKDGQWIDAPAGPTVGEAASFPDGSKVAATSGSRYGSTNIRLSAALCALGFILRDDAEPVERVVEFDFKKRVTCPRCRRGVKHEHIDFRFWHTPLPIPDSPVLVKSPKITATDIEAWWRYPARTSSGSKFSVEGFDDALMAMRRVLEVREWLLGVMHGSREIVNQRFSKNSVITTSLRFASVIKTCGHELLAMERGIGFQPMGHRQDADATCRFVFPAQAVRVIDLISKSHDSAEHPEATDSSFVIGHSSLPGVYPDRRDDGLDLCIDWQLWALEYHARLMRKIKAAAPMIEMRDGDRVCRVHHQMPKTLRREFTGRF